MKTNSRTYSFTLSSLFPFLMCTRTRAHTQHTHRTVTKNSELLPVLQKEMAARGYLVFRDQGILSGDEQVLARTEMLKRAPVVCASPPR